MERTLIVARMDPRWRAEVAAAFAESDAGELPARLRVTGRWLFGFHDLYVHLIEAEPGLGARIAAVRDDPLFAGLTDRLKPFIEAYSPATWRGPRDAMAEGFYAWPHRTPEE